MRLLPLALIVAFASACSTFDCNSVSCVAGCCQSGVCYEGSTLKYGAPCDGAGGGGGTGGSGGGASVPCLGTGRSCTEGGVAQCCFPTSCVQGACATCLGSGKRCDNSSLPCCLGSCSGTGYCDTACSYYSEPCNDAKACCKHSGTNEYNDVCVSERCTFCSTPEHECNPNDPYDTPCCPGLRCALKPGFTSVYSCQF